MQKIRRIRVTMGIIGIVIEMIWKSNGNDKFKECREVKIIEKENICKNLVFHNWFYKVYF